MAGKEMIRFLWLARLAYLKAKKHGTHYCAITKPRSAGDLPICRSGPGGVACNPASD